LVRPRSSTPRHVVVFHEAREGNAGILSRVLGVGEARGRRARSGVTLLRARSPTAPCARVYGRLGVAVADLDEDQLRRLDRCAAVEAVVPNRQCFVPASSMTRETRGRAERASSRVGADRRRRSWCLDMIGIPSDHGPRGRGVTVAVLDTGVDLNHPDLAPRSRKGWEAASFVPHETAEDRHGHGTHCVGVVAGPLRSVSGTTYGVAPEARILAGKVLSDAGSGFCDWILDGIDWAAGEGARIVSLSFISSRTPGQPYAAVYERVAANLLRSHPGTLLLAAAGNASERPWYTRPVDNPAACPSLLSVAAVHRARRIATFSGRQMDDIGEVNLSAPGVGVYSAWVGGEFRTLSGTSMAVPHVAGVAALYLEEQPTLTGLALWRLLEQRAIPMGDARDFGRGLVQAGPVAPVGAAA